MTFSTPWLGAKRVAFVPLFRSNAAPPDQIPPDWEEAILRRVIDDPRPQPTAQIVRCGHGCAPPPRAWPTSSRQCCRCRPSTSRWSTADELEDTLGGRLRDQGIDAGVLVMLGNRGAGNNAGFWSRVVMRGNNGVWLMELIHGLTGFQDLYTFDDDVDPPERDIDSFDEMSASSQTHPTAFTKNELGWLAADALAW